MMAGTLEFAFSAKEIMARSSSQKSRAKLPKGKGKPAKGDSFGASQESVRILISHEQIQKRIAEMAGEIRRDFPSVPLHLVGVLKGSVFFLTDLARQMQGEISIDFIAVSSYGNQTQ